MGRPKIYLNERVKEFEKDGLYLSDSSVVMCKYCNVRVEGDKKDTLMKHVRSAIHVNKSSKPSTSGLKRQSTLTSGFENQKRARLETDNFVQDTVKTFLDASIPIEKIDHPSVREYFQKYIPGSGKLPAASDLRKKIVPAVGQAQKDKTKAALRNKPVVIIADETSDKLGRCVFAVLLKTIDSDFKQECFLAGVNFLDAANSSTCSQSIIETLKEYEIDYNQVKGLVSDSARYMSACFGLLKVLIGPNILHFQCLAHKINLISGCFINKFAELNTIVAKVKSAFSLSRKMKSAYTTYLRENAPALPAKVYPVPVITRWNSWFKSVLYLKDYLQHISGFFDEWPNENSNISFFKKNNHNDIFKSKLNVQISFVAELCPKLMKLTEDLEGSSYPFAHELWNRLEDLKASLTRYAKGSFGANTSVTIKNERKDQEINFQQMLKSVSIKALNKLSAHMQMNETNEALRQISQFFCPSIAASIKDLAFNQSIILESFSKIPFFKGISQDNIIDGYSHFHRLLIQSLNRKEEPNVLDLLWATKCSFPQFANAGIQSIWVSTNSVDAERFFSKYNIIVKDRRTNLTEKNVEITTMLSFNDN